ERVRDRLDAEVHRPADEAERAVPDERSRQKAGLAQHLEAVADAEHVAAAGRELGDRAHDRREARDRAAAEIVAVGEAARQEDAGAPGGARVLGPRGHRFVAEIVAQDVAGIPVVARAGKGHHAPLHAGGPSLPALPALPEPATSPSTSSKWKSSITPFASRR